ncbi:MAG: murein L,D-transpeptidase catalytic domain-containing protein, partial [Candidatus Binatia bacterium]
MRAHRSNGLRAILLLAATTFLSAPAAQADNAAKLAALAPDTSRAALNEAATLAALAPDLSRAAINEALTAVRCAKAKGVATDADRLAIVDYTRSSQERRLWIFDLQAKKVLFQEFVAHGKGSGEDVPTDFSNRNGSHQT